MTGRLSRGGKAVAVVAGLVFLAVLVPVGVQAVTSSVTISDPQKPASKARVLGGKLLVGDGLGPLTVDGKVSAIPAPPKVPLWGQAHLTDTNRHVSLAGPFSSTNVFHVTSLTFANTGTTALEVRVRVMSPGTKCDVGSTPLQGVEVAAVAAGQTVSTPFPTPLQAPGPCLTALLAPPPPSGSEMWVTVVGYR